MRTSLPVFVFGVAAAVLAGFYVASSAGPSCTPPNCPGAVATDASNNLAVGTSTTSAGTKFLVVGSSTDANYFAVKINDFLNNAILWVRNDGRVSIATSSFSTTSTVWLGGPLRFSDGTVQDSASGGGTVQAQNVSNVGAFGANTGGGNYSFPAKLSVGTSTAGTGDLYVVGNVGIGTAAAAAKLDVIGRVNFGDRQNGGVQPGYLSNTWTSAEAYKFFTLGSTYFNGANWITNENAGFGSNNVAVVAADTQGINFYTQGSTGNTQRTDTTATFNTYRRMTINPSGNVGIGTISPSSTLHVIGTIQQSAVTSSILAADSTGKIVATTTTGGGSGVGWSRTDPNVYLTISTDYVGIGTATPTRKLHVVGPPVLGGDSRQVLAIEDTTAVAAGVGGGLSLRGKYMADGSVANFASIKGVKENATDGDSAGSLVFTTSPTPSGNNTERMRIDSAGRVGIGTASPLSVLHVSGTAIFGSPASAIRVLKTAAATSANDLGVWNTAGGGGDVFKIASWNSGLGLAIDTNSGYIGIGTSTPGTILHVRGASGGEIVRFDGGTSYPRLTIDSGDAAVLGVINRATGDTAKDLYFGETADTGKYIFRGSGAVTTEGKIGIGTSAPVNSLQVSGSNATLVVGPWSTTAFNATGSVWSNGASAGFFFLKRTLGSYSSNAGDIWGWYNPDGTARLWTGVAGDILTVSSTGLDVTGNIRSSGNVVIDSGAGWHRTYNNTGWYNSTYCGGWYMIDTTYIRSYCSKAVYLDNAIYATAFFYTSDERLKTNIRPIQNGLASILALQGVAFDWKKDGTKGMGLVAQDVERVLPEAVITDKISGMKSLDGAVLTGPIVEAIKELNAKIEAQSGRISELEGEIERLKSKTEPEAQQ